ncbi:hypothetical protein [Streptomyces sp. NPDC086023]|uniref:hypothetical protein n=1 Tax=Streptomyces sp. NPDC086023 TaxID=3365746 RepID=UPI0037CF4BD5
MSPFVREYTSEGASVRFSPHAAALKILQHRRCLVLSVALCGVIAASAPAMALDPGSYALTPNGSANTISAINIGTGAAHGQVSTIAVPNPLTSLSASAEGFTCGGNEQDNTLSFVDVEFETTGAVDLGTPTYDVAASGSYCYTANPGSSSVSQVDARTRAVRTFPLGFGATPTAVAVSPSGDTVYATDPNQDLMYIINTSTGQFVSGGINNPTSVAASPDGKRVYAGLGTGQAIAVFEVEGGTVAPPTLIAVNESISSVAVSPDSTKVYAGSSFTNVYVVDVSGPAVTFSRVDTQLNPNAIAAAGGDRAYTANGGIGTGSVGEIDTSTTPPTVLGTFNVNTAALDVTTYDVPRSGPAGGSSLVLTKSAADPLVRGGVGRYELTVRNQGSRPTSGVVGVRDLLPAGLVPTGISGRGWDCSVERLACTRRDSLAAGAEYPPIVLKVRVEKAAPDRVTNTATVTDGGAGRTVGTATTTTVIKSKHRRPH